MHEHHVGVFLAGLVQPGDDGGGVGDVPPAGNGDQRSLGKMRHGLAVLAGAHEVAGVDGGGSQVAGLAGVRSAPGPPCAAGVRAVGFGGFVAHDLEGVAPVGEVLRAVGDKLQFAGLDLGSVLRALKVAKVGQQLVGGAVEALGLGCPAC